MALMLNVGAASVVVGGLTSPGGSARPWFPWRTPASFGASGAGWSSPSAGSGSQTAPGGWSPGNPVNHRGGREEEGRRKGAGTEDGQPGLFFSLR